MTGGTTQMRREVEEIPQAVERLLSGGGDAMRAAARAVSDRDPAYFVTVARGTSDHACTYFKYAAELLAGLPVASVGPSVASIYKARLRCPAPSACRSRNRAEAPTSLT
jgi:glucosamine--fructose-6-phosphate aminotransferase (isomerizing)